MDDVTVEDVKGWSRLDFEGLPEPYDDDQLEVLVARASDYVADVTGRTFSTLPANLETTAEEAIQKRTEQLAIQSQPDSVETATDELIQSFTAGSYSETKRSLDEQHKAQLVNPWPALHDLLWRLMTDDKRDEWMEWFGVIRPTFETTEVDWSTMGEPWPDYTIWGA